MTPLRSGGAGGGGHPRWWWQKWLQCHARPQSCYLYPAEGWPLREWGWKRCRPLPAACRGIPEGSGPGPPGFPSPPHAPARRQPRQEEPQRRDQLQPLPPGPARNWGARGGSKPPAAAGQREQSGGWNPRARGGLAAGNWVLDARIQLGTPWEPPSFTKGEVPAHQRRAEAAGAGAGAFGPCQRPAPPPHGAPTALRRGPVPAHLGPGSCPPPRRGTQPIAVATATSSGCIFCTRAAVGTWTGATSFRWALWAAFVAGVEPSWQPLPPRAPPAPRGSRPRPGGGGRGLCWNPQDEATHPLRPPTALSHLEQCQARVASKAAPSEGRAHGHGAPSPCQGTWDPQGNAPPPPPPAWLWQLPRGSPGGSSTGVESPNTAARAEIPMCRSHSPQPASGFPHPCLSFPTRQRAPGQALPRGRLGAPGLLAREQHDKLCRAWLQHPPSPTPAGARSCARILGLRLPTAPPPSAGKAPPEPGPRGPTGTDLGAKPRSSPQGFPRAVPRSLCGATCVGGRRKRSIFQSWKPRGKRLPAGTIKAGGLIITAAPPPHPKEAVRIRPSSRPRATWPKDTPGCAGSVWSLR